MRKKFTKLHLKGTSNKIYFEAYDLVKLDELLYNFFDCYNKVLEGIAFENEMNDKKISLDKIYS